MALGDSRTIIPGVLELEHVQNSGIAFGLSTGNGIWTLLLVGFALLVASLVLATSSARNKPAGQIAIGLILGGAIGNLVDRLPDGYVTDYVAVGPWPRFNIADSALTCGIALLIWLEIRPTGDMST
jgi:signal peptidase II